MEELKIQNEKLTSSAASPLSSTTKIENGFLALYEMSSKIPTTPLLPTKRKGLAIQADYAVATVQGQKNIKSSNVPITITEQHEEKKKRQPDCAERSLASDSYNSHKGGNKETNQPELRLADLERRERLAVGVHGRVEPQVLGAEAAPKGFVGDGGAEAGAGAGEHCGGARPGLGNDRVDDEPLHAFQPRRGRRRWIRRRR